MGRIDAESETLIPMIRAGGGIDVAHALRGEGFDASEDGTGRGTPIVASTLTASWDRSKGAPAGANCGLINPIINEIGVRRLTPRECERLQGFPDDYTAIPFRGKPAADSPRYKALGNSMAVNVMRWIGQRIAMCERVINDR
jgi:DNA (cytosine-5)-methyltransferase 1